MADKIAVQRTYKDENGEIQTVIYDPFTNQILKNPLDVVVVDENTFKAGEVDPNKPNAIPRVVRGDNGMNYTIWVDASTGQEVYDLSRYNVLDQQNSNIQELGLVRVVTEKEQKEVEKTPIKEEKSKGEKRSEGTLAGTDVRRDMANNFGYINRPDIMNYAGFVGGPIGLAAKAANLGLNLSNTQAVNAAQETLGFTNDQNRLGQILKDKKGYIGDLSYNGTVTSVGLEAQDNLGRTTLTPDEARKRQALLGATQSTPEQQKMNVEQFKEQNPGLLGKARGLLGKIFGKEEEAPAAPQKRETGTYTGPTYTGVTGSEEDVQQEDNTGFTSGPSIDNRTMGFTAAQTKERMSKFSPEDRQAMAETLAGEIDFRQSDLNSPVGLKEAYSILSTMENRAPKYGSVKEAAFAPNQYSTWNNAQVSRVAKSNYKANQELIDKVVDSYISNPDNNYGFTSYYNPSIAGPSWGNVMENSTKIGPHKFGNLPEYGNNPYTKDFAKFGQQLNSFENDREQRAPKPAGPTYGLNPAAQDAYKDLDSWYSGPKGVVGPKEKSPTEDRTDRASKERSTEGSRGVGYSGTKSSGFSEDRTDRASKVDKTGGFGKSFGGSGFSEDRTDRASKVDKTGSSGFGSMADARNNDRGSVGGYSGSNKSSSGKSKGAESRSDGWT